MTTKTFEEFLRDKCPAEWETNNDPAGNDRWQEQLDTQEVMDFAEEWGEKRFLDGKELVLKTFEPNIAKLQETLNQKLNG